MEDLSSDYSEDFEEEYLSSEVMTSATSRATTAATAAVAVTRGGGARGGGARGGGARGGGARGGGARGGGRGRGKTRADAVKGKSQTAGAGELTPKRRAPTERAQFAGTSLSTGARRRIAPATKTHPHRSNFTSKRLHATKKTTPYSIKALGVSPAHNRQMSAKNHTIHSLQNKLSEKTKQFEELRKENKLINRLQVRQERELNKIQLQEDELPQILSRHSEEVRSFKKQLKVKQEEVGVVKQKTAELLQEMQRLSEHNQRLQKLVKKKRLMEREQLSRQVEEMTKELKEKDRRVTELERGLEAASKNHSQEVRVLKQRNRALATETESLRDTSSRFQQQLKERTREMDILNIYSQRIPRSVAGSYSERSPLHTTATAAHTAVLPLVSSQASQTDLSCPPLKMVSLKHRAQLKSVSSQANLSQPQHSHANYATSCTQTDVPPPPTEAVNMSPLPQTKATSPPPAQSQLLPRSTTETIPKDPSKELLIQRLREMNSQKPAPSSNPLPSVSTHTPLKQQGDTTTQSSHTQPPIPNTQPTMGGKVADSSAKQDVSGGAAIEEQKKQLLLAKLLAIDEGGNSNQVSKAQTATQRQATGTEAGGTQSSTSVGSRPDIVENLHQGKPAYATEDDPFGSQTRLASSRKSLGRGGTGARSGSLRRECAGGGGRVTAPAPHGDPAGYRPSFGRRAAGSPASFPHHTISSKLSGPLAPTHTTQPTAARGSSFPWQNGLHSRLESGLQNGQQAAIFGEPSSLLSQPPPPSLLPLRPKAEPAAMRSYDIMPGGIVSEPDDIEELVL